jgi:predicted  nucleic acid-binding Zn-ribbon protein
MSKESLMNMAKKAMKHKRKAEEEAPLGEYEERFDGLPEDLDELRGKIENNRSALDCFRGDISIRERFERISREIQAEESELVKLEEGVNSGESVISGMKVRSCP